MNGLPLRTPCALTGAKSHTFAEYLVEQSGQGVDMRKVEHLRFAPTWANSMAGVCPRRRLPGRWPRFVRGFNGGPGRARQQNPAALVATPKLPKHLPRVPSIEQMNHLVETAAAEMLRRGRSVIA